MTRIAKRMLVAAVSTVLLGGSAYAQMRVEQNGNALDANTRVGSGGYNTGPDWRPHNAGFGYSAINGNNIVTGNVTGLGYFHGGVPYSSPLYFRGNTGSGQIDNFIARSSGAPGPNQSPLISMQPQTFYAGPQLAGPPPAGFVQKGFTQTYTPPPPSYIQPQQYTGVPLDVQQIFSPTTGTFTVPGEVNRTTGVPEMLTSSPLLGVRPWKLEDLDQAQRSLQLGGYSEDSLRRLRLDQQTIQQLRQDLERTSQGQNATQGATQGQTQGQANQQSLSQPLPSAAPLNTNLPNQPLTTDQTLAPLADTVRPEGSLSSQLRTISVPVAKQSQQYAQMQEMLDRYYGGMLGTLRQDEQKNQVLIRQLQALQKQNEARKPVVEPKPGEGPAVPGTLVRPIPGREMPEELRARISRELAAEAPQVARPEPMKIKSLATGVKAEGLRNVLSKAESLMKGGNFLSALDEFNKAQAVAPENQMITLGKANAELGAGLYQQASLHLQRALTMDPVLTMAQFDLKEMMGQQRLETIVKDLKDVATRQKNDPTPVVLLAYLAYNTGNEQSAANYLTVAQERSGGNDAFVRLLQTHWSLPAPATTQPAK